MKLWCMILCIACTVILSGLTIAQETKSPPNLKARIKLFKNTKRFSVSYDKFKDITEGKPLLALCGYQSWVIAFRTWYVC